MVLVVENPHLGFHTTGVRHRRMISVQGFQPFDKHRANPVFAAYHEMVVYLVKVLRSDLCPILGATPVMKRVYIKT